MLKKHALGLVSLALFSFSTLVTSCYSSQQLVQPSLTEKVSRNPKFLDGVALNGPDHVLALSSENLKNEGGRRIDVTMTNAIQVKFASLMDVLPRTINNMPL